MAPRGAVDEENDGWMWVTNSKWLRLIEASRVEEVFLAGPVPTLRSAASFA